MPLFVMILIVIGVGALGGISLAYFVIRYDISQILNLFRPVPYMLGWAFICSIIFAIVIQLFHGVISLERPTMTVIGFILGLCVGVWHYVKENILQGYEEE